MYKGLLYKALLLLALFPKKNRLSVHTVSQYGYSVLKTYQVIHNIHVTYLIIAILEDFDKAHMF